MNTIHQALAIVIGTFVSEDLAWLSALGLAREGALSWSVACLASGLGIFFGDLGVYVLGRSGRRLARYEAVSARTPQFLKSWRTEGFAGPAVFVVRFIPGTRVLTYFAAGAVGMGFVRFSLISASAVAIWIALGVAFGAAFPKAWGWTPIALMAAAGIVFTLARTLRFCRQSQPHLGRIWRARLARYRYFEFWPMSWFYAPVLMYYFALALRYGSLSLPVDANPGIPNGGIVGESKSFILSCLRADEPARLRFKAIEFRHESKVNTAFATAGGIADALAWMKAEDVNFPVILKPDVGQRGSGVGLIESETELHAYAEGRAFRAVIQEYCAYREEVGVNYRRYPHQAQGEITGVTRKRFPAVCGDGRRTLTELILDDRRARYMAPVYLRRFADRRNEVLPPGRVLRLVEAGNHCQGAIFEDGGELATPALAARLDEVAQQIPGFFYGRFDLRFSDEESLKAGGGFKIIEVNGGAGEATHIYDARRTLTDAYRVLFAQLRDLFAIGLANRNRGERAKARVISSFFEFLRESKQHPPTT